MDDALYFSEQHLARARWFASSRATKSRRSPRSTTPTRTFPWENIRKMGELGLLGVPWPEELGGAGSTCSAT